MTVVHAHRWGKALRQLAAQPLNLELIADIAEQNGEFIAPETEGMIRLAAEFNQTQGRFNQDVIPRYR